MGDRGNIIIEADGQMFPHQMFPHQVFFYTHWCGSELPDILKDALIKGKSRWGDSPYLARVIFQQMLGEDKDVTGFGISTAEGDGGTEIYVNIEKQTVRFRDKTQSFEQFCE